MKNGKFLPSSSAPLLSSSAEGWRSSLLRKTSWVPELRSRTTSAIHQCLFTSIPQESPPSRPSPSWGRRNAPYIHTSIPLYIHNYPSSGLRPPSPARGEGKKLSLDCFGLLSLQFKFYIFPWNVLEITSSCCSFVSLLKFTAYPDTLTVNCGYFSG